MKFQHNVFYFVAVVTIAMMLAGFILQNLVLPLLRGY